MYCQSVCYSELREKINKGGMWKQDAVKFKWVIFTVCGVVFGKYFSCRWTPLSEVYYMGISVSSEFSHIFVSWRLGLFIVCEYEFSPEPYTTSETTDLRRAMDATAVDCEWQANFWGSRGVFVCFFSPLHWNDLYKIVKENISPLSPFLSFWNSLSVSWYIGCGMHTDMLAEQSRAPLRRATNTFHRRYSQTTTIPNTSAVLTV